MSPGLTSNFRPPPRLRVWERGGGRRDSGASPLFTRVSFLSAFRSFSEEQLLENFSVSLVVGAGVDPPTPTHPNTVTHTHTPAVSAALRASFPLRKSCRPWRGVLLRAHSWMTSSSRTFPRRLWAPTPRRYPARGRPRTARRPYTSWCAAWWPPCIFWSSSWVCWATSRWWRSSSRTAPWGACPTSSSPAWRRETCCCWSPACPWTPSATSPRSGCSERRRANSSPSSSSPRSGCRCSRSLRSALTGRRITGAKITELQCDTSSATLVLHGTAWNC